MVAQQKEVLKSLAIKLHEIDAIKFGTFLTKSGLESPIYFDLRVIISYPDVMVSFDDLIDLMKRIKIRLNPTGNAYQCAAELCVRAKNRIRPNLWSPVHSTTNRNVALNQAKQTDADSTQRGQIVWHKEDDRR